MPRAVPLDDGSTETESVAVLVPPLRELVRDLDAAAQYFQSAIIYAPTNPVAYHRLGQLYARNGQRELAGMCSGVVGAASSVVVASVW